MGFNPNSNVANEGSFTLNDLVLLNLRRLDELKENEEWTKAYYRFHSVAEKIANYLPFELREKLQLEHSRFLEAQKVISANEQNETSRKIKINELRRAFVMTYSSFFEYAYQSMDLFRKREDAEIELKETDIDDYSKYVGTRNNSIKKISKTDELSILDNKNSGEEEENDESDVSVENEE